MRTLMERLSRGRLVRRTLPPRVGGGPIWLSPESALRYWTWNLDDPRRSKLLIDVADRFARSIAVVWDIGANCGVFAAACSGVLDPRGSVLAIEPDTAMSACLHRNATVSLAKNRAPITVLECAVSHRVGTAAFNVAQRGRATNFLASSGGRGDTGGVRGTRLVVTVSLDWLAQEFPSPQLMKIDVEGAEVACLEGAKSLLSRAQPIILIEVSERTRRPILDILAPLGYRFADAERMDQLGAHLQCANLLAIPAGHAA